MAHRRNEYDPLANRVRPHWLEIRTARGDVLECAPLAVGIDLRAVMAETIPRLAADGWQVEGDGRLGFVGGARDEVRCLAHLRPTDPQTDFYGPSRFC